ncbi:hypothetical protein BCR41DRAFT_379541 [Lobosporangium transversale]|uniref:Oxysterol-binding protein n=1 Tax=Lobosporangium transversale TaxID=64571 RepID=A0A1Y2H4C8_9FUNG|nr:hypothetical protein BCR41DRAFT_379541 [Lobosporangium transversale]ORZ28841.1 hypothetical protein BCR41DRAFT_379541 [Lobosporangium transversale]|eukprot:XP_021886514.1 hypothetical protein BCR41DRAFT_379541 [Lobosporangium transversale]
MRQSSDNTSMGEAPAAHKDTLRSFITTLASFSGDLSALTCPSFLLSSVSLLEYSQYWGDHPKLFASISSGTTPEDRLLSCTRWFISTLYSSYSSRSTASGMEKKPYNPILGEQYFAQWTGDQETGDLFLKAEQVSHHPPIMAFHLENKTAGVILEGQCGQKSHFAMPAGINVSQTGHAIVTLPKFNETYLITLPTLHIRGIITGRPTLELAGSSYIISSVGHITTIEYSSKGFFSGERNHFEAILRPIEENEDPFYKAQGVWSKVSTLSTCNRNGNRAIGNEIGKSIKKDNKSNHLSTGQPFFDAQTDKAIPPELKPLDQMGPLESLKLWAPVTQAILNNDYNAASKEKSQIEEAQRALAKARKEKGQTQADDLKLFKFILFVCIEPMIVT